MKEKPKKKKLDQGKRMFLYMLPFLLLCFAFSYFPLHGWIYSFYDYKPPLKLSQCNFMGLRWFKMIFGNPAQVRQLFIVMRNTFAMSFLNIATSVLPLFFAVFLNEIKCKWFRKMVQTLTTIPNFISWVLVYAVAFCLFSNTGMVNTVFQNLGVILKPIKFLDSDSHTYIAILAGAVSNCIMNYFFIKWWGPVGATYASFLGLGVVFTLRAIDAHNMIGMSIHPARVLLNFAVLAGEALVLLAEVPLYGLWTGLITLGIILYNFAGVWAMARILLPKLLGRRGKALVKTIDSLLALREKQA